MYDLEEESTVLLENDFFVVTNPGSLLLVTFLLIKNANLNKVTKEQGFPAQCLESLRKKSKIVAACMYSVAVKICAKKTHIKSKIIILTQ